MREDERHRAAHAAPRSRASHKKNQICYSKRSLTAPSRSPPRFVTSRVAPSLLDFLNPFSGTAVFSGAGTGKLAGEHTEIRRGPWHARRKYAARHIRGNDVHALQLLSAASRLLRTSPYTHGARSPTVCYVRERSRGRPPATVYLDIDFQRPIQRPLIHAPHFFLKLQ